VFLVAVSFIFLLFYKLVFWCSAYWASPVVGLVVQRVFVAVCCVLGLRGLGRICSRASALVETKFSFIQA